MLWHITHHDRNPTRSRSEFRGKGIAMRDNIGSLHLYEEYPFQLSLRRGWEFHQPISRPAAPFGWRWVPLSGWDAMELMPFWFYWWTRKWALWVPFVRLGMYQGEVGTTLSSWRWTWRWGSSPQARYHYPRWSAFWKRMGEDWDAKMPTLSGG